MVRRYSNTPHIPQGMTHSLYLDIGHFSMSVTFAQFPLERLHLHWLLPFSRTKVLLPCKVGEEGLETYPPSPTVPMGWFRGGTLSFQSHLPVSFPADSSSAIGRGTQTKGGSDCHPTSMQTEGVRLTSIPQTPTDNNQTRAQLEYVLIQEAQELAKRYKCKQAKQA